MTGEDHANAPAHADAGRDVRTWPLCFTHKSVTTGTGFAASAKITGLLLAHQETDGIWLEGVTPGGIVIDTDAEALGDLKPCVHAAIENTLESFAEDAKDFAEFEAAVRLFVETTDAEAKEVWQTAVEHVRQNADDRPDDIDTWPADEHEPAAAVERGHLRLSPDLTSISVTSLDDR